MPKFPEIIRRDKTGKIPHFADIGADILIEELYKWIVDAPFKNEKISAERVKQQIDKLALGFETNPRIIVDRQKVIKHALENPRFVEVIGHLAVYPDQTTDSDGNFTKYTGVMRRFETFVESVTALRNVLLAEGSPGPLNELLLACEEAAQRIEAAQRHLNPDFELRIEVEGRYGRGVFFGILAPEGLAKCEFFYVLLNKSDNSVQRGQSKSQFGLFTYRKDYFLEGFEKAIEDSLILTTGTRPIYRKVYNVNGVVDYNLQKAKAEGELHYDRDGSDEAGTFSISYAREHDDTPRAIIEMARFTHNYQVLSPFEEMISDFEDAVVELKALAATTRFFQYLQKKGFPLNFPEIIPTDAAVDLSIKKMYHPLLAYFGENESVIPNHVETTAEQNVKLITGANNNGKTCFITGLGLNQVLFQAGMPIVARESIMKPKDRILTHYVRPGDIKASQSRFAHECDRVLKLIEDISSDSLILCDELFTGTAPQDGEIVSKLVLETLIKTGATLFFITHYHALGAEFRDSPYVAQLCCKLDHTTDPPAYTYKIEPGISEDSDGLVVAAEYGVNQAHLDALLAQKARRGDFYLR